MEKKLTTEQLDALQEIVNIGSGNAATALAQLIKKKINIEVPKVHLEPVKDVAKIFGKSEEIIVAVYLRLLGDASGVIMYTFPKAEAARLADLLMGFEKGKTKVLSEMTTSALKEAATILAGAYLGATGKVLNMRLLLSSPSLAQDMAGAVVDAVVAEMAKDADQAIVINTELYIVDEKIVAYFFFVPDGESLGKILNALGVNG